MELTEQFAEVNIHDMHNDDKEEEYHEDEEEYYEEEEDGDEDEDDEEESSEEDASSSSPDYDMREYGIHRALPVRDGSDSDMDDYDGPALTAEAYLRQVRREAAGLPYVIVAEIDARNYDELRTAYISNAMQGPLISGAARPPEAFLSTFLHKFDAMRETLQRLRDDLPQATLDHLPSLQDEEAWRAMCLGSGRDQTHVSESLNSPHLDFLASWPQAKLTQLLKYNVGWLGNTPDWPDRTWAWIYAICALLETPLHDTTEAILRDLLRSCATAAEHVVETSAVDCGEAAERVVEGGAQTDGAELARIQVLVAIAGAYFRQDEGLAASAAFLSM